MCNWWFNFGMFILRYHWNIQEGMTQEALPEWQSEDLQKSAPYKNNENISNYSQSQLFKDPWN